MSSTTDDVTAPQPSRRTPEAKNDTRWVRSHALLLSVGLDLLSEYGPENLNLEQIITEANVSKRTFYNHFCDIEDLTEAVWHDSLLFIEKEVANMNQDIADPALKVARGMAVYARAAIESPARIRFLIRYWFKAPTIRIGEQGLEADLSEGLISGRFRIDHVETTLLFISGAAGAMLRRILESQSANEAARITQEMLYLMMITLGLDRMQAEMIAAQATEGTLRVPPVL